MAPPLIHLKDIRLSFSGPQRATRIVVSVLPAERVPLIGRSDVGPSVLLKFAAPFTKPK